MVYVYPGVLLNSTTTYPMMVTATEISSIKSDLQSIEFLNGELLQWQADLHSRFACFEQPSNSLYSAVMSDKNRTKLDPAIQPLGLNSRIAE